MKAIVAVILVAGIVIAWVLLWGRAIGVAAHKGHLGTGVVLRLLVLGPLALRAAQRLSDVEPCPEGADHEWGERTEVIGPSGQTLGWKKRCRLCGLDRNLKRGPVAAPLAGESQSAWSR